VTPSLFDLDRLSDLGRLIGQARLTSLCDQLKQGLEAVLNEAEAELTSALAAPGPRSDLATRAHQLRGSSASLGLNALAQALARLEAALSGEPPAPSQIRTALIAARRCGDETWRVLAAEARSHERNRVKITPLGDSH